MKLVFGLGNPGSEYQHTRHNVGFMVVDKLAGRKNWSKSKSGLLHYCWLNQDLKKIELIKPQTFMNKSGEAMGYVHRQHPELELTDVYVAHDDLDLELGNFKLQWGVGPKQHHGLLSIYQQLKTTEFWHVRVGVDGRQGSRQLPPDKYVLSRFHHDEQQLLAQTLDKLVATLKEKLS